ncbi:hypothetical protein D3C74_377430 [compost metagenome]
MITWGIGREPSFHLNGEPMIQGLTLSDLHCVLTRKRLWTHSKAVRAWEEAGYLYFLVGQAKRSLAWPCWSGFNVNALF